MPIFDLPIAAHTASPVALPVAARVAARVAAPVAARVAAPVAARVAAPVAARVAAPVAAQPCIAAVLLALALQACVSGSSGGSGATGAAVAADAKVVDIMVGDAAGSPDSGSLDGAVNQDAKAKDAATGDTQPSGADIAVQDTGVTKDETAKQLAEAKKAEIEVYLAYCKQNFTCETGVNYSNTQACIDELLAEGGLVFFGDGLQAIAVGNAKFDASKLAGCLATLDSKCTFFKAPRLPQACADLFVGLVDVGFACTNAEDCKTKFCKKNDLNDDQCKGACAVAAKVGASCAIDEGCEMPSICSPDNKCAAYTPAKKGDDCLDVNCAEGLYCLEDGDTYTCFDPIAIGAECNVGDFACKGGSYCLAGAVGSAGKCVSTVEVGKSCNKSGWYAGLSDNPCVDDHVCVSLSEESTQATCEPLAPVGKPCKSTDQCKGWDEQCSGASASKLTCNYLPSKGVDCDPLEPEDLAVGFLDCLPPFVCNPKTTKCVDRPPAGKACIEFKCATDLWCDSDGETAGVCNVFADAGQECIAFEEDSSCKEGLICGAKTETCQLPVCK
ncbi:MAG: hypothetical protein EXR77_13305 [Myxococcales bacterium]|nr:hypothetical protein [Myxococcales bacterium]